MVRKNMVVLGAHGASITYIDRDNNLQLAQADPHIVLEGARPHIVDEWQKVPGIWNAVRHEIDLVRGLRGGWILTGSSTPPKDSSRHSGAGRIGRHTHAPNVPERVFRLNKERFARWSIPGRVCCRRRAP